MLDALPFRLIKRAIRWVRVEHFTVPWPEDVPTLVWSSEDDVALEWRLRAGHHWEGVPFSYHYEGECLNLRRPAGLDDAGRQLADHLRARRRPDGDLEVIGHREASRYEHREDHIDEVGLRWLDKRELRTLLEGGTV